MADNVTSMYMPDAERVGVVLDQVRAMVAASPVPPHHAAAQEQAAATMAELLGGMGIDLRDPAQAMALLVGALVGLGSVESNPGLPLQRTQGVVMAMLMRATEGLAPPTVVGV